LIGWRNKKISLVHVDDLTRGICLAAESDRAENQVFSIANPEAYDWLEIMNEISRALGTNAMTIRIPESLLSIMAGLNEKLARVLHSEAVFNMDKANEMKQDYWLISSVKAAKLLDFKTQIDLEQGLRDTAIWYKQQGWL
jgi:nucleoside-diphosphate-sugar epimerase